MHHQNFYFRGGHSAAYKDDHNLMSLAACVVNGSDDHGELIDEPSKVADYASRLNWAVWALLLSGFGAAGWLVAAAYGFWWLVLSLVVLVLVLLTL
ncbi:MAG TPA: hypothetical protein VGC11_04375 [Acidimicrobiia bacterium]